MTKISIIIPCYNAESYIDRCMESIERQTIGMNHLEVILVDDASEDGTLEKLREWEHRYPDHVVVAAHKENWKQGAARNTGIRCAAADYIGFVDADDWIEPDMYQMLWEKTQEKKYDIVRGKFIRHDCSGKFDETSFHQKRQDQEYYFQEIQGFYLGKYEDVGNVGEFGSVCTGIYRKSLLLENQIFFPEKTTYEDNYWMEYLSLYVKSCYIIDKVFYHYMSNTESTVMKRNAANHLDRLAVEKLRLQRYKELGLLDIPEFYEKIQRDFILLYYLNTLYILFKRYDMVPADLVNEMIVTVLKEFPNWEQGTFLEETNRRQRMLLQLLKEDRTFTQQEVDEIQQAYLENRLSFEKLTGNLSEIKDYIHYIRIFWKKSPSQITLEEQAFFVKIKQTAAEKEEQQWAEQEVKLLLQEASLERRIYVYTFLIDLTGNKKYLLELLALAETKQLLSKETKYFLYGQLKTMIFLGKLKSDLEVQTAMYEFLKETAAEFRKDLGEEIAYLPEKERNRNRVLVVTEQFLDDTHGPTKSAMARCRAIIRMGKQVLLINTAEQMTSVGAVSIFDGRVGNYMEKNSSLDQVKWKDAEIPFFQCDRNMPDMEVMRYLLQIVREWKPYYAVAIGGDGIFVSLLNDMLPVLAVSMVPSAIGTSLADYQTLGRKLNDEDMAYLKAAGRTEQCIIEHKFTSDLKEQSMILTRKMLGIDEDMFVLVVIGGRLSDEMTEEFCGLLNSLLENSKMMAVILGNLDNEQEIRKKFSAAEEKICFAGGVKDVLAYLDICDLYVNPIRTGGGTSCVEAMAKGLPVVTTARGDVALNAGEVFWVEDYPKMQQMILKYYTDKAFYQKQSEYAQKRAKELLDTDRAFCEVIREFSRRESLSFDERK